MNIGWKCVFKHFCNSLCYESQITPFKIILGPLDHITMVTILIYFCMEINVRYIMGFHYGRGKRRAKFYNNYHGIAGRESWLRILNLKEISHIEVFIVICSNALCMYCM